MKVYKFVSCIKFSMMALLMTGIVVTYLGEVAAGATSTKPWKAPSFRARKKNPVSVDTKSIQTGRTIYVRECQSCHGPTGRGDGPAAKDLATVPGNLTDSKLWEQSDGALYWKLTEGRSPMPAFKTLIGKTERWHVINYVRSLAPKAPKFTVPVLYRQAVSKVLTSYFNVGSALAKNDAGTAQQAAKNLMSAIGNLTQTPTDKLGEQARTSWSNVTQEVSAAGQALEKAQGLQGLQKAFKSLSGGVINLVNKYGHAQKTSVYQLHCDKALSNEGAAWLQAGSKILNPYLGQTKNPCGTVILKWK